MPLTTCFECNRPISASADTCPGCSSHRPLGVVCELCNKRLPWSAGVVSKRRESQLRRSDLSDRSWYIASEIDREIVAHKECLVRLYSPPVAVKCSDCGSQVPTSDLGLTPLSLWTARFAGTYRCTLCRGLISLGAKCAWAAKDGHSEKFMETASGAYPCMRALYSFQVGPNGLDHGTHAEQELDVAFWANVNEATEAHNRALKLKNSRERERDKTGWAVVVIVFLCAFLCRLCFR